MPLKKKIVAVVGPGEGASDADMALGHELGKLIAARGWIQLSAKSVLLIDPDRLRRRAR